MCEALKLQRGKDPTLPLGAGHWEVSLQVLICNNKVKIHARSRKDGIPALAGGKLSVTFLYHGRSASWVLRDGYEFIRKSQRRPKWAEFLERRNSEG